MRKSLLFAWWVLCITMPILALGQSRQITGSVTDEKGTPLPFVTVMEKGTKNGTSTDEQGLFSIAVTSTSPVLVFSYAGRQTQELVVGTGNTYNVSLSTSGSMSEVVVTALGIRKEKKALGYSAQEVSCEALSRTKESNIVNALRGQAAGVQINSGGGAPGQGTHIVIRGVKSLGTSKNNQPLFVVDGVPISNESDTNIGESSMLFTGGTANRGVDLDARNIADVSILKGASATALYGSRAANGAVIITTRSGQIDQSSRS